MKNGIFGLGLLVLLSSVIDQTAFAGPFQRGCQSRTTQRCYTPSPSCYCPQGYDYGHHHSSYYPTYPSYPSYGAYRPEVPYYSSRAQAQCRPSPYSDAYAPAYYRSSRPTYERGYPAHLPPPRHLRENFCPPSYHSTRYESYRASYREESYGYERRWDDYEDDYYRGY